VIENWILQAIDQSGFEQEDVVSARDRCVGRQTYGTWGGDILGPLTARPGGGDRF